MPKKPMKLYKYESVNTHSLSNLKKQQIYFSKPKNFNDPFDCSITCSCNEMTKKDLHKLHKHLMNLDDIRNDSMNKNEFKKRFGSDEPNLLFNDHITSLTETTVNNALSSIMNNNGISCFSEINNEILMWSHYADSHKGFCLEFDTSHDPFENSLKVTYNKKIPRIDTVDFFMKDGDDQVTKACCTKHKSWKYEKEWRVLKDEGDTSYGYPAEALTAVYFGAEMDFAHLEIIALIIQSQNQNVKFYQGKKSKTDFLVEFTQCEYIPYIERQRRGV